MTNNEIYLLKHEFYINLRVKILELKNHLNKNLPVIVKIAPDLNEDELKDIAEVVMRKNVNFRSSKF